MIIVKGLNVGHNIIIDCVDGLNMCAVALIFSKYHLMYIT